MIQKGSTFLEEIPVKLKEILQREHFNQRQCSFSLGLVKYKTIVSWATDNSESSMALWHIADWDSEQLGVKCAKIDKVILISEHTSGELLIDQMFSGLSDYAGKEKIDNIFYRIPSDNRAIVRCAEKAGFKTIGIHLNYVLPFASDKPQQPIDKDIRIAGREDNEDIVCMSELIVGDRFHRDGRFSDKGISKLWRTSVSNAVNDWADVVYVYEKSGRIAGFIIVTKDYSVSDSLSIPGRRIFLITVLPEYRRQGIGKALIQAAIYYSRDNTSPYLMVGTHSSNDAAISLYQSSLFRLNGVFQELSWWHYET
jgi:GNAT superfamily N-acetyltransferase